MFSVNKIGRKFFIQYECYCIGVSVQNFRGLKNKDGCIDKNSILTLVPYKEKFLFIDTITALERRRIRGRFTLQKGTELLDAHFKDFPIMPGALVLEGMGQLGSVLVRSHIQDHQKHDVLAYKIKDAKFLKPVLPGSVIEYDIKLHEAITNKRVMQGQAFVKEEKVAECFFTLIVVEKEVFRKGKK